MEQLGHFVNEGRTMGQWSPKDAPGHLSGLQTLHSPFLKLTSSHLSPQHRTDR